MRRVFGAIAIVLGVYDITKGVSLFSGDKQYGLILIGVGLLFILLGVRYLLYKKKER